MLILILILMYILFGILSERYIYHKNIEKALDIYYEDNDEDPNEELMNKIHKDSLMCYGQNKYTEYIIFIIFSVPLIISYGFDSLAKKVSDEQDIKKVIIEYKKRNNI